ncbi:MAG: sugar phosphate isomerase/epimerase [Chthoniobacteraceae bacterium]
MKIEQVAAQLYTLRNFVKTPADIATTLKKVREIGFQAVQASALGPIEESELVKILAGEGLVCCATHESGDTIINDPQAVVEKLQKLGCKYTAYPYPSGIDFSDEAQVHALAKKLNASGAVLRKAGQVLTYHNHAIEFVRYGDKTALDIIYEESSKKNLQGEIDTYWVQYGGADPVEWCKKLKGRLPLLHMKDYAYLTSDKHGMAEIGSGNLNWKKIVAAAEKSGCEWFIVEQDVCPADPFDSLKKSFEYIAANLVS